MPLSCTVQAQSKEKTLAKMVRSGLTEKVQADSVVRLNFTDVGKLPPPVLQFTDVTFGYSRDKVLYSNVRPFAQISIMTSKCFADYLLLGAKLVIVRRVMRLYVVENLGS